MRRRRRKPKLLYRDAKLLIALVAVIIFVEVINSPAFPYLIGIAVLCYLANIGLKHYERQQILIRERLEKERLLRSGIDEIDCMEGYEFERFLHAYFVNRGFQGEITPSQGDYGADIIITDNTGRKTAVQAKRYKARVGVEAVQEVVAGKHYYNCQHAMVITNSQFTRAAKELAHANGVELWDRETLIYKLAKDEPGINLGMVTLEQT